MAWANKICTRSNDREDSWQEGVEVGLIMMKNSHESHSLQAQYSVLISRLRLPVPLLVGGKHPLEY